MAKFKAVDYYPKKKRSKPWYVAKESQFVSDVEKLFDIFCEDSQLSNLYFPTWFEIDHYSKLSRGSKNVSTFLKELSVFQIKNF